MDKLQLAVLAAKHWKVLTAGIVSVGLVTYIVFLHHVIASDNEMLEAANKQMGSMSAEYRANVLTMTASLKAQNEQIAELAKAGKDASAAVAEAEKRADNARSAANAKVNALLARPTPVGCENSIKYAIDGVSDLKWDTLK